MDPVEAGRDLVASAGRTRFVLAWLAPDHVFVPIAWTVRVGFVFYGVVSLRGAASRTGCAGDIHGRVHQTTDRRSRMIAGMIDSPAGS